MNRQRRPARPQVHALHIRLRLGRGDESAYSLGEEGGYGQVDGTIAGQSAVEFDVGSIKQIRVAILDPALHPSEGKMLVPVETPGRSTQGSVRQAGAFLSAYQSESGNWARRTQARPQLGPCLAYG